MFVGRKACRTSAVFSRFWAGNNVNKITENAATLIVLSYVTHGIRFLRIETIYLITIERYICMNMCVCVCVCMYVCVCH